MIKIGLKNKETPIIEGSIEEVSVEIEFLLQFLYLSIKKQTNLSSQEIQQHLKFICENAINKVKEIENV